MARQMEVNKIYQGTCLDVMKTFPDKSIDCVITSPPYWQLRDYGWSGQWGMEKTFQEYLEHLWQMIDEVYRVLKDTGTVWVNLGDTYGTQSGNFNKPEYNGTSKESNHLKGNAEIKQPKSIHKCLLLIPHRFAIGCIDRGWIMRNDIKWIKRNSMPESVTDRVSKKSEYFFFMVKSEKYFFDLDAIRDRALINENRPDGIVRNRLYGYDSKMNRMNGVQPQRDYKNSINGHNQQQRGGTNEKGKNPGDVSLFWDNSDKDNLEIDYWDVLTKPSKDEHFASYNTKLIDKPIMAGCTKGGIILDPFAGTCTTGVRAVNLQRKFIGIEGKPEYVKMGNKKLNAEIAKLQLF